MAHRQSLRRRLLLALALGGLVLAAGLALAARQREVPACTSQEDPMSILVATDLHYLSPRLTDGGAAFQQVAAQGDGLATAYLSQVTEAFVAQVLAIQPDLLILSGDLTFNGTAASHADLAEQLAPLQAAGIQVLVLPGNHDLNNPNAARFVGAQAQRQPSLTVQGFRQTYWDFGFRQALSRDWDSLSYCYAPRADLRILLVDTNSQEEGRLSPQSLRWVRRQLEEARDAGAQVIAVSHQTLLDHNSLLSDGYRMADGAALLALYQEFDVLCNLSGHLHLQHMAQDGVTDIVTSALPLSPNQYGALAYDETTLQYETQSLDVSPWAAAQGSQNENLLHFAAYARTLLLDRARQQILDVLADSGLPADQQALLAETFAAINAAYFAGDPIDQTEFAQGLALWEGQAPSFYTAYLQSILEDGGSSGYHTAQLSWKTSTS